jgi:hypothetical protein
MWRTLEPFHGLVYFVPEAAEAYGSLGIEGRMGYFASRAAPMGPVPAEVVIATFYNFHPGLVRSAIPEAWRIANPERIIEARFDVVDRALRRLLGEAATSTEMEEASSLAREAADACRPEGRVLYAGHASLDWPDAPHMVLWHAVTLLREFRGDGHVAALVGAELDGCEALVTHAASGAIGVDVLRRSREWPQGEWDAASRRLRDRGLLAADGTFTDEGHRVRAWVEERTDGLAQRPWEALGAERCARLRELVRTWSRTIVSAGTFAIAQKSDREE